MRRLHEARLFSSEPPHCWSAWHHSRLRGRGVDFDQVRIYQPGDDDMTDRLARHRAHPRAAHTAVPRERGATGVRPGRTETAPPFFGSGRNALKGVLAARAVAFIGWPGAGPQ